MGNVTMEGNDSPTQRVVKNSLWLIIQPLVLNVISLAVAGYIARILGAEGNGARDTQPAKRQWWLVGHKKIR